MKCYKRTALYIFYVKFFLMMNLDIFDLWNVVKIFSDLSQCGKILSDFSNFILKYPCSSYRIFWLITMWNSFWFIRMNLDIFWLIAMPSNFCRWCHLGHHCDDQLWKKTWFAWLNDDKVETSNYNYWKTVEERFGYVSVNTCHWSLIFSDTTSLFSPSFFSLFL